MQVPWQPSVNLQRYRSAFQIPRVEEEAGLGCPLPRHLVTVPTRRQYSLYIKKKKKKNFQSGLLLEKKVSSIERFYFSAYVRVIKTCLRALFDCVRCRLKSPCPFPIRLRHVWIHGLTEPKVVFNALSSPSFRRKYWTLVEAEVLLNVG